MSGGSFNYLSDALNRGQVAVCDLRAAATALRGAGCVEAADATDAVVARIEASFAEMGDVWHALEWWHSGDWSEEDFRAAHEAWKAQRSQS